MSAAPVDGFAMSDPLLNAVEAAKLLGVTPRTIRNYAADGRLPGIALGGVTRSAPIDHRAREKRRDCRRRNNRKT